MRQANHEPCLKLIAALSLNRAPKARTRSLESKLTLLLEIAAIVDSRRPRCVVRAHSLCLDASAQLMDLVLQAMFAFTPGAARTSAKAPRSSARCSKVLSLLSAN